MAMHTQRTCSTVHDLVRVRRACPISEFLNTLSACHALCCRMIPLHRASPSSEFLHRIAPVSESLCIHILHEHILHEHILNSCVT